MTHDKEIKDIIKSCKESSLKIKEMLKEIDESFYKTSILRKEIEVTLLAEGFYDNKRI